MLGLPSWTFKTFLTFKPCLIRASAVPDVAIKLKPRFNNLVAIEIRPGLSRSWVDRNTIPLIGKASPAANSDLAYAIPNIVVVTTRATKKVSNFFIISFI